MTKRTNAKRIARQSRREDKRAKLELVTNQTQHEHIHEPAPAKRLNAPLAARNPNQQLYIDALQTKRLIFSTGSAGVGKTYLATSHACRELLAKDIDRIVVTRPVLQADEDLGFLPGDVNEKFAPYFRPVYDVLLEQLGGSFLEYCLKPGIEKVEIAPFAFMRGRTFKNAVVILDEAQNVTVNQMKLFLTRIGENCTVIVNGDITQCDLPHHKQSGLQDALRRFQDSDLVGVVNFTDDDCVRSDICALALDAYSN